MSFNKRKPYSLTATESNYFNDDQNKIEIVSCVNDEMKCEKQLSSINRSYLESEQLRRNKDYPRSIAKLKDAFLETIELEDSKCAKCTLFFQQTISDSLIEMKEELKKLTTGFFASKYYQPSFELVIQTIKELEEVSTKEANTKQNKTEHSIDNTYLNKNVG